MNGSEQQRHTSAGVETEESVLLSEGAQSSFVSSKSSGSAVSRTASSSAELLESGRQSYSNWELLMVQGNNLIDQSLADNKNNAAEIERCRKLKSVLAQLESVLLSDGYSAVDRTAIPHAAPDRMRHFSQHDFDQTLEYIDKS